MKDFLSNKIFVGVNLLLFFISIFYLLFPESYSQFLSWVKDVFVIQASWVYTSVVLLFFYLACYLIVSPYRNFRLGKKGDKPEYSFFTWFAMLFSAGMGTGVMFSGVYEPLYHYTYPPQGLGIGSTPEALDFSLLLTFVHWGFAGWALYGIVGFSLAYFFFYKNLPLRFSSAFQPIFKEKIKGSLGYGIDILVVLCTLFGVATTLGRGALQINAGLTEFFNIPYSVFIQSSIIISITLLATLSVLSGLNRGIRRLSELNIFLCLTLLLFVLFLGPTGFLLKSLFKTTGSYLYSLVQIKFWFIQFGSSEWRSQWTTLYWAWWMAWAPFVGIFIARISKGRTVKEFILGALLVPSLLSFLWFVVFGGTAIHQHIQGTMNITSFLKTDYSLILFKFLEYFPLAPWISYFALLTILIFFITSSDSASYMISRMTSLKSVPKISQKIYWAFLEGFIALFFLLTGGIRSLEQMVIILAFPFSFLLLLLAYSLIKSLREEAKA